ncbi:hypothetical protein GCM10009661_84650 [Catellatospora chokoriensis]
MHTLALAPQVFRDKARRAAGSGSTGKRRNAGSGNLGCQPHKRLNAGARPPVVIKNGRAPGVAAPLCRMTARQSPRLVRTQKRLERERVH